MFHLLFALLLSDNPKTATVSSDQWTNGLMSGLINEIMD